MDSNKNIAVVGCGYWGKNLVRNFHELSVLGCVSDTDVSLAKRFSSEYKVPHMGYDEILLNSEIVAVVLAVPAELHSSLAIKALKAGKHVYVEKPLATSKNDALEMIKEAKENNVHLMVGHLLQYHPIFIKLKEMISKNDFGELQYIYSNRMSFGKLRSFEDVIWSFAPHDISMMLALSKSEVDSVRSEKFYGLQENICDIATIHLTFKSGLRGHIQVSWLNPVKDNKLVVIGTKGMAIFDDTQEWNRKLKFLNYSIDLSKTTPIITKHDEDYINVNESEPLKEECKHFIDLVNGKVQALTDGEEGLRVLNILSEASRYNKKNTNYDSE